jgi:flagellar motor protein MotB
MMARTYHAYVTAMVFVCGCVSVEEYTHLREQLEIEQRHAREFKHRERQLEVLTENLQKRLRLCSLERDEAREKLAAAEKTLPIDGPRSARAPVFVGQILFDAGRVSLTEEDQRALRAMVEELAKMHGGEIVVAGHSDPTPIGRTEYQSNMHLSAVRALAVYHALVRMPGIQQTKVSVAAYGEFRPRPGRPKDLRRVEVLFVPAGR